MKKIIVLTIMTAISIENMALGETVTNFYKGKAEVGLRWGGDYSLSDPTKINFKATLNQLENGRAKLELIANNTRHCGGFSTTFYAEDDGFGGYALYASKEDWTTGHSVGSVNKYAKGLGLNFSEESFSVDTLGDLGRPCRYYLGSHFNAQLTLTDDL